jgi:hypothetical protein
MRNKLYKKSRRRSVGKSAKKVVKKLYKGAVKLGTFETKMHTFIGYFVGFLLGLLALYFIIRENKYSGKTTATIQANNDQVCSVENPNAKNLTYNCTFKLVYTINGERHTKEFSNFKTTIQYSNNQTITIYYNVKEIDDISLSSDSSKSLGFILLGVALLIIFLSWFQYYKVKKFKIFAAEEGVNTIFKMFK